MKTSFSALLAIAFVSLFFPYSANSQPTEGLIAYYPLNGNANDASDFGHNGTIIGNVSATSDRFAFVNSAMHFSDSTSRIYVPYTSSLDVSTVSVSAWVRIDQLTNYIQTFVTRWHNDSEPAYVFALEIYTLNGTAPYCYPNFAIAFDNQQYSVYRCINPTPITVGVWTHLCGTFDGTTVKLYINGQLVHSITAIGALQNINSPLMIGAHDYNSPIHSYYRNWTYGSIDEVRIYNRALSATEVMSLYGGINVLHPTGGETLMLGTRDTIRWICGSPSPANVFAKVNYNYPNGDWATIISSTPNTGQYVWTVSGHPTQHARIKVVSTTNPDSLGVSFSDFSIISSVNVESPNILPSELNLTAYPNPFNSSTTISFSLPKSGNVELKVYDIQGRVVNTLMNGWQNVGEQRVRFDGKALQSGVYVYRLIDGNQKSVGKMMLVK